MTVSILNIFIIVPRNINIYLIIHIPIPTGINKVNLNLNIKNNTSSVHTTCGGLEMSTKTDTIWVG